MFCNLQFLKNCWYKFYTFTSINKIIIFLNGWKCSKTHVVFINIIIVFDFLIQKPFPNHIYVKYLCNYINCVYIAQMSFILLNRYLCYWQIIKTSRKYLIINVTYIILFLQFILWFFFHFIWYQLLSTKKKYYNLNVSQEIKTSYNV